jgi:hypothetical protein
MIVIITKKEASMESKMHLQNQNRPGPSRQRYRCHFPDEFLEKKLGHCLSGQKSRFGCGQKSRKWVIFGNDGLRQFMTTLRLGVGGTQLYSLVCLRR